MASSYSASKVGLYFVQQYYRILQYERHSVSKFYTDSSSIVRVDGDSRESASTLVHINTLILSISFSTINIKTVNSVESWNGGVLVVVSGCVKPKGSSRLRNFVQTFFLAPQEKGVYFVLNDVFHFGDEVPENNFDALQTSPNVATGCASVIEAGTEQEGTPWEEPSAMPQNAVETSEEPEPSSIQEPVREPSKRSYASLLRERKPAPSVSIRPSFAKSTPPPPLLDTIPELADESFSQEGKSMSVFVGNLPSTTSTLDITQEFERFGSIKKDGVFLKNPREGVYYAFVEFEDIQSAKNAIKASPIKMDGRKVYINERRGSSLRGGGRMGMGGGRGGGRSGWGLIDH